MRSTPYQHYCSFQASNESMPFKWYYCYTTSIYRRGRTKPSRSQALLVAKPHVLAVSSRSDVRLSALHCCIPLAPTRYRRAPCAKRRTQSHFPSITELVHVFPIAGGGWGGGEDLWQVAGSTVSRNKLFHRINSPTSTGCS